MSSSRTAMAVIGAAFGICTIVAMASAAIFQPEGWTNPAPDFPRNLLTRAWVHWDANWYAAIARDGYWYKPGEQSPVAFFPTYPTLMAALHALGINRFVAGIFITAVAGCGGLYLFNRWATHLRGEATALRATTLFVAYPFAFYLYGVIYSDAVFLLVVVGAFYALEKDKLWLAILLGALATAARPVAPAVVVGLVARRIEIRLTRGERLHFTDLLPALAGLGLAAYMAFLWHKFGDPLAFVHVQSAPGWDHPVGPKAWFKLDFWGLVARRPTKFGTLISLFHGAIAITAVALAIPLWRKVSKGYAIYAAAVVGIPLVSSKDFMGLGRYAIAAFPIFLALAVLMEARPRMRIAYLSLSALGLIALTMLFAADRYVA